MVVRMCNGIIKLFENESTKIKQKYFWEFTIRTKSRVEPFWPISSTANSLAKWKILGIFLSHNRQEHGFRRIFISLGSFAQREHSSKIWNSPREPHTNVYQFKLIQLPVESVSIATFCEFLMRSLTSSQQHTTTIQKCFVFTFAQEMCARNMYDSESMSGAVLCSAASDHLGYKRKRNSSSLVLCSNIFRMCIQHSFTAFFHFFLFLLIFSVCVREYNYPQSTHNTPHRHNY